MPASIRLKTAVPGPLSRALAARRDAAVPRGIGHSTPVYAASARGALLTDVDGNVFIDFAGGIGTLNAGHANPEVVRAAAEQLSRMTHSCFSVAPYEGYLALAETLNRITPGRHAKKTMLANSGAEALENAVKIARHSTGREAVVVFEHAFHGRTLLTMSMTSKVRPYKFGFGPFAAEVYRMPFPYVYRGHYARTGRSRDRARGVLQDAGRRREGRVRRRGARPRRGRLHRRAAGMGEPARPVLPRARHPPRRRRSPDRLRAHREDVRLRALRPGARPHDDGQVARRRVPDLRRDRPRRDHGQRAGRRPRRHLRRQPGRVRGGARRGRSDRAGPPAGAGGGDRGRGRTALRRLPRTLPVRRRRAGARRDAGARARQGPRVRRNPTRTAPTASSGRRTRPGSSSSAPARTATSFARSCRSSSRTASSRKVSMFSRKRSKARRHLFCVGDS